MTLLARLIAKEEGFGVPGAIPTVRNNPGDLSHAPNASHEGIAPDSVGIEPSAADGWADLERQLQLYASRGLTLGQMAEIYAPPFENDTASYLAALCSGLNCTSDTLVSDALEQP
jgi:hypothetical protein